MLSPVRAGNGKPACKLNLPKGITRTAVNGRAELIRAAVIDVLSEVENATSAEMAEALGVSVARLRFHLNVLYGTGEIRRGPRRLGSNARTWQIATSVEVVDCSEVRRSYIRAVQQGDVQRDVLVAALFGPAGTRPQR